MTADSCWCQSCETEVMPVLGHCPICRDRVVEATRAEIVVAIRTQLARIDSTPDG